MFYNASSLNSNLSGWDVSSVTNMSNMFNGATAFNQNLGNWNVSNVTDMSAMFNGATSFNSDISNWNVSNVTNMNAMFSWTTSFNQGIGNWNVSNVTNMSSMFNGATAFNQNIGNWNVSQVTDMNSMLNGATSFNPEISSWNVSIVTNMSAMFNGATAFNPDISNWNVSNVTNMSSMFNGASSFNQNIGNWNVSNVSNTSSMFNGATAFNQDISNWDVLSVNDMSAMFNGATAFNQNIGYWNVSNVTSMSSMFNGATSFNQNIGNWNVSNVTNMRSIFNEATAFNQNITIWNVSNVTDMRSMFNGATAFNQYLAGWNISNINSLDSFLANARLSRANYDALLVSWSTLGNGYSTLLSASFGSSRYSNLPATTSARNELTSTYGWRITDGGIQNDVTLPTITSSSLSSDNSAITITFSKAVYPTFRGTGTLATTGFEFAITGGTATLSSTTPTSISTTDNLTFVVGIGLNGTANGSEVVTVKPVVNSIFDLAENEASTAQNNNTVQLKNLNPSVAPTITDFNAITKYYFNQSTTITNPPSKSTGLFSYTSDNTNVATIQENTITFTGVGTSIITATQTADAAYESGTVTTLLTVVGANVVNKNGAISPTNTNYVNRNGQVGAPTAVKPTGEVVVVKE